MYLVGVISENKEIKKSLEKEFDKKQVDCIDLNTNIIENFKNVKFDIILIADLNKYKKSNNFKKILSNATTCLINTDKKENLEGIENLKGTFITYGFNSKATITASSVDDTNISVCIQRVIDNINNKKIEPIEYVENLKNSKNIEISDVIGVQAIKKILAKKKN